jgi:hypothetical protein
MEPIKTLQERLLAAGVGIDHHCSDLYFPVSEISNKILREYTLESAIKPSVGAFICNISKAPWYEVPFHYSKTE